MRKISILKFLPGIAWFFIVVILTCLPGKDIPKVGWLDKIYFDKWVHIGMFGGLTFWFCWPFYKSLIIAKQRLHYFVTIAALSSTWGLCIEFIQKYFILGRSYDLLDWAADSLGCLIAFIFCKKVFIKNDKSLA